MTLLSTRRVSFSQWCSDNALALLALKTLGQAPAGAEILGTASNLITLLELVASLKDDPKAPKDALRCIANTLLLAERARSEFISEQVNGGEMCISWFENSTEPDQIFVLSRILFCSTVDPSTFITSLVETKRHGTKFVDIIPGKLDFLLASLLSGTQRAPEALAEALKFTNNILVHYPKSLDTVTQPDGVSDNWSSKLDPILPPLFRLFEALLPTSPAPIPAPLAPVISCLIWVPISLLPVDVLLREHDLLEVVFSHYFPNAIDPDDPSVRELAMSEAAPGAATDGLDMRLMPLVALITRQCTVDETFRAQTRDWLCPSDLDRSAKSGTLESRPNTLGRCLRLLGSVYHAKLKTYVGQMLFAMCDSDAATMSTLLGYGNVAGFLFTMGIMTAPPAPTPTASTSAALSAAAAENINPITGTAQGARAPDPEMSPEEKEREMEKLFVLFDRLERTGTLPPSQNPIRRAIEQAAQGPSLPDEDGEE
ncbi:guanine nucleotide exchange factor [Mycena galopus ATCC 62051]|nr:guanine nucleotide exchange factor [Mycena galopus ATCC 62051]